MHLVGKFGVTLALALAPLTVWAKVPDVVVDLPVVGGLVAAVIGDLGQPVILLERGADAHDFQLRPSQAGAVDRAGLVIWIGAEMSPWLDRALLASGNGAASVPLLQAPGVTLRPFNGVAGTIDPHAWFDPANAKAWVDAALAALAAADPANAATYGANANRARADIDAVDAQVRAILEPVGDLPVIMFHDAFGYFAATYGLNIVATIEEGDAADPGAARIAAIRALLQPGGKVCAFPEATRDPAFLRTIAEGNSLHIGAALDPEAVTLEPGPGLYRALMIGVATAIADCAKG